MALRYDEIVRTGLSRQVADLIRQAITKGRLSIDERLPAEDELARRFGVSRPTVREALKVLAAQNLIRSRRGPAGGNFVARPDPEGLARSITDATTLLIGAGSFGAEEIVTARMGTEELCCRLAAANRDDEHLAAMAAEVETQRRNDLSDEDFCASDVRFHRAIVEATRNGPLQLMMYAVIESFVPVTNMLIFRDHERMRGAAAHERIMGTIARRDADGAADAMRGHLQGMRAILDAALVRRAAASRHNQTGEDNQ
jgi:GntR family transcriptional regulator, transcriptional repressor for pyruvate dehydrogenase complex